MPADFDIIQLGIDPKRFANCRIASAANWSAVCTRIKR